MFGKMPNPGSKEAIKYGCLCSVIDNHYGDGFGRDKFYMNGDCPLHGIEPVVCIYCKKATCMPGYMVCGHCDSESYG